MKPGKLNLSTSPGQKAFRHQNNSAFKTINDSKMLICLYCWGFNTFIFEFLSKFWFVDSTPALLQYVLHSRDLKDRVL